MIREQEASRKPAISRQRAALRLHRQHASASQNPVLACPNFTSNPGTDSFPSSETWVGNRYDRIIDIDQGIVIAHLTAFIAARHISSNKSSHHGRNKRITQWSNYSLQIPKPPQPRPRRSTSSAPRNDQRRASPSTRRASSIQQR